MMHLDVQSEELSDSYEEWLQPVSTFYLINTSFYESGGLLHILAIKLITMII